MKSRYLFNEEPQRIPKYVKKKNTKYCLKYISIYLIYIIQALLKKILSVYFTLELYKTKYQKKYIYIYRPLSFACTILSNIRNDFKNCTNKFVD